MTRTARSAGSRRLALLLALGLAGLLGGVSPDPAQEPTGLVPHALAAAGQL